MGLDSPRKYPVVKPHPSVDDCIRAARIVDYVQAAGITAFSWGFGFIRGKPARFGMANLMSAVGLTFASFKALQDIRGRLMGFRENSRELMIYGTPSDEDLAEPKVDMRKFT